MKSDEMHLYMTEKCDNYYHFSFLFDRAFCRSRSKKQKAQLTFCQPRPTQILNDLVLMDYPLRWGKAEIPILVTYLLLVSFILLKQLTIRL